MHNGKEYHLDYQESLIILFKLFFQPQIPGLTKLVMFETIKLCYARGASNHFPLSLMK